MLIKICGIKDPEHVPVIVESGADLLGLVFYPASYRHVDIPTARQIVSAVREQAPTHHKLRTVGLFVNQNASTIIDVQRQVGFDIVQLAGDEAPALIDELDIPVIPTVRADPDGQTSAARRFDDLARKRPWAIIVDAAVPGAYGGTGQRADWELAGQFARRYPTILAGGLTTDNVTDAIAEVQPFAIDVSSGVESNKRKDPAKIRSFITRARAANLQPAIEEKRS